MVQHINEKVEIGQIISLLEALHHRWLRRLDILPPIELRRIITQARSQGLQPLPLVWYYEHVHTSALWENANRLVFQAQLPFTNDHEYISYQVQSWPVPYEQGGLDIRLEFAANLALDTLTGSICVPGLCQGHNPSVCRTGPVYDRRLRPCMRGLLLGGVTSSSTLS